MACPALPRAPAKGQAQIAYDQALVALGSWGLCRTRKPLRCSSGDPMKAIDEPLSANWADNVGRRFSNGQYRRTTADEVRLVDVYVCIHMGVMACSSACIAIANLHDAAEGLAHMGCFSDSCFQQCTQLSQVTFRPSTALGDHVWPDLCRPTRQVECMCNQGEPLKSHHRPRWLRQPPYKDRQREEPIR